MDRGIKSQHTTASSNITHIPPVVSVLGHVDHGKTTLLDAIRKTSLAKREFGGITQKIGASTVEILHEGQKRRITFIDTPGHEVFSKMRSRGAVASDIGLLIVAANDGVKPQTSESIKLLKDAGIPYIVVLTKSDLPVANPERVKQQLLQEEVLLEGYGGDVPVVEVSATTNHHVKELLDLILLVFDLRQSTHPAGSQSQSLHAIVIESKLEPKSGPRATVVIKEGTLNVREDLFCEGKIFRVRTLINDQNQQVKQATVGDAVEILGMDTVPNVGSIITAQQQVAQSSDGEPTQDSQLKRELVYSQQADQPELAVIMCADTQGALEAITNALPKEVKVLSKKTGEVTEADILLAKSTGGIVLSFNSRIRPDVQKLAATEKVLAKNYQIIYEMLDEIRDVLEGKKLAKIEEIYGTAKVLAKFPFEKTFALGISVLDGRVARGDKIRIMRGDEKIGESTVISLRVGKNPTSKIEKGHEAGIIISPLLDFNTGDMIICHG